MTRPLRIAFFVHEFPALSETFVLNQITGLLDLGHDVTIFAERPRAEPVVHDDVGRYGLPARTRYLSMPTGRARRIAGGLMAILRNGRLHQGAVLKSLDIRRYGRDATSLRLLFWLLSIREEKPFDVVHCHFGPTGQLAAKLRDVGALNGRLVTAFHGVDISAYVRDQPDYYRFLFASGDLFQPISQAWSRKLADLGCDPTRIEVHHMGIDTARYPFTARRYKIGRALHVLTVGRMVEKKGIADGLGAVAELVRQNIPVLYTIVGDGPLRPDLEQLVVDLRIAPNVRFCGWQDQVVVARLMAENDVLLAPSATSDDGDQEGIPVTLMEAMAAGMVVVSTYHSGIPELIEHGRSGLLVPEHDVPGLAWALIQLMRSAETWPGMSEAAHDTVTQEFEISTLNRRLVRRYEALVDEAGKSALRNRMFIARRRFATN